MRIFCCSIAVVLSAAGCVMSPAVDDDPGTPGELDRFADTVVAVSEGGVLRTCTDVLPACGEPPVADCAADAVLGAPDSVTLTLEAAGRLEVAFRCGAIVERGGTDSPDLQVWATVPDSGAAAVVEISADGSRYHALGTLTMTNQVFDTGREDIDVARFVRIVDQGTGGIEIDSLEALAQE